MLPKRLNYLARSNKFIEVITEQAKQDKLTEKDFYLILGAKCKSMDQERQYKIIYVKYNNKTKAGKE